LTARRELFQAGLAAAMAGLAPENSARAAGPGRVQTGVEVLAASGFGQLKGLRLGLITNPSGVLPDLTSTIDALHRAPGVNLRALFGPEHGVRGDVPAGEAVAGGRDAATNLPVHSLYGRTKVPTAEMLAGLDALVFDLQDIGSRSYTYLSTLGSALEGASLHKVPVVVLDRPNPIGLTRIEGGPPQPGFFSFVGKYPVAYRHGMTLGELARMIVGEGWLPGGRHADVTVIACRNLTREMGTWEAFGTGTSTLPWVPTSPHIPESTSPLFYAATGITGELSSVSIGVGYTQPFELAGAPGVGAESFAHEMTRRGMPGVAYRAANWTPFYGGLNGRNCGGVQIYLTDPARAPLTRLNFEILDALRTLDPHRRLFTEEESSRMFDLDCGTDRIRKAFLAGAGAPRLWEIFEEGRAAFETRRQKYLIYK
jgi:uncharacterized protein YbbC (DUF1343 family)